MWFKFNTDDYLKLTEGMTASEIGIYTRLIVLCMSNGTPRPLNLTRWQMIRFCGASTRQMDSLINVLETRFRLTPEGYRPALEQQFLNDTDAPAADTRVGPALTAERIIRGFPQGVNVFGGAPGASNGESPAISDYFQESNSSTTTEGQKSVPERIAGLREVLQDGKEMRPKYRSDDPQKTKADRHREYVRDRRVHMLTLRKTLAGLGVTGTEGWGLRKMSAAIMAKIGELERIEEPDPLVQTQAEKEMAAAPVIDGEYLELSDNVRAMQLASETYHGTPVLKNDANSREVVANPNAVDGLLPDVYSAGGAGVWGRGGSTSVCNSVFSIKEDGASNVSITRDYPPEKEKNYGTAAGAAARAVRQRGIADVNPSHPDLLRLLAQGVTPGELADVAEEAVSRGKGRFAYVLAVVDARRRAAAAAAPLPGKAIMPSGETVDELDRRIFGED